MSHGNGLIRPLRLWRRSEGRHFSYHLKQCMAPHLCQKTRPHAAAPSRNHTFSQTCHGKLQNYGGAVAATRLSHGHGFRLAHARLFAASAFPACARGLQVRSRPSSPRDKYVGMQPHCCDPAALRGRETEATCQHAVLVSWWQHRRSGHWFLCKPDTSQRCCKYSEYVPMLHPSILYSPPEGHACGLS